MQYHYSEVRYVYLDVMEDFQNVIDRPVRLTDKIAEDLGLWGDDNVYYLDEFVTKYQLDFSDFSYEDHFESEGELCTVWQQLLNAIFGLPLLAFWITWLIVKRIFPSVPTPRYFDLNVSYPNPRKDLTVGDLIAWRLAGRFVLREEACIRTY